MILVVWNIRKNKTVADNWLIFSSCGFCSGVWNFGYGVGLLLGLKVGGRLIQKLGLVVGYNEGFILGLKLGLYVLRWQTYSKAWLWGTMKGSKLFTLLFDH